MDKKEFDLEQSLEELGELVRLSAGQKKEASYETIARKAESIYEGYLEHENFPSSHEIAVQYAKVLFNISFNQEEESSLQGTATKIGTLYDQFSKSVEIATGYAVVLLNLSFKQSSNNAILDTVKQLETLYNQFSKSGEIAFCYVTVLVNSLAFQKDPSFIVSVIEKISSIHDKFPGREDIAKVYAEALIKLMSIQAEKSFAYELIGKIYEEYPKSEEISFIYIRALANSIPFQIKRVSSNELLEMMKELYEKFPSSERIAFEYTRALFNLSLIQNDKILIQDIVNKIENLYNNFPLSERIALGYSKVLVNFFVIHLDDSDILEEVTNKVEGLNNKFLDSEDIALSYAIILFNRLVIQVEVPFCCEWIEQIKKIYEKFSESENISFVYAKALVKSSFVQTEESYKENITKQVEDIYKKFSPSMLKRFDGIFFNSNKNEEYGKELATIWEHEDYQLFNFILKEGLLSDTKYSVLQNWAEHYKENSAELINLLAIYQHVQKIKYQLGLKDEDKKDNLKFGHYTKGSVLQILLDQKREKNFSVSGKTRLNNANYMNDPEEGIIIEKILGLDRRDDLEPSSWFLMSFTSKTDDLAMWSQYGDDAKGVCIVLREDDFARFTSFNDVSWRRETNSSELSDKMYTKKSELNSGFKNAISQSEKEDSADTINDKGTEPNSEEKNDVSKGNVDYLYRIAYVNYTNNDFEIAQTELFNKDEITELKKSLKSLKKKLDDSLNKKDDFYQKAISDCIEEIRYLFKSVDYKYEDELRILRYANLDPNNEEIKIDKFSGVGKLYVERENPIQIDEIIFGPKFPNPEYVTPLLKLLDKKITFKKSTIKFR